MEFLTTVVGSYPTHNLKDDNAEDPFRRAIEEAVRDQIEAGVKLISDGQVRGDMIKIFASKIMGYSIEKGRAVIVDRIQPPKEAITVNDFLLTKELAGDKAEVKGIITGPFTMALGSSVAKGAPYRNILDPELIFDLAKVQSEEARALTKAGAEVIQIDEPAFSLGVDLEIGKETTEMISRNIKVAELHVCGDVAHIFRKLLEMDVSVLDHEFTQTRNLDVIEREMIESYEKKIGYGCVNTKMNEAESVEVIERRITEAVKKLGAENIWIDPDCGMRLLSREVAREKLKNMVIASRRVARKVEEGEI
ncbi:MAG: methionine synthase [Archaeoglobi archaeon]|nr:methionine synthase [Candidatus Mnemosynella sp.]